jgi:hypothetical protein
MTSKGQSLHTTGHGGSYTFNRFHVGETPTSVKGIFFLPSWWPLRRMGVNSFFKCSTKMSASTPSEVSSILF